MRAEPAGGLADHRDLGAAPLREDLRPRAGERAGRRRDQEADLLLGEGRRRALGGPQAGRSEPVPPALAARSTTSRRPLVFSKLQARTGGRLRFFVSGGAPLPADIAKFFYSAGLPILEGYGLTETSPVISVNRLRARSASGTVGAADRRRRGEDRGRRRDPHPRPPRDDAATTTSPRPRARRSTADGWFHTGDIGEFDADGYLKITDRKKDLIVTAGGKKIAPQPIEEMVKHNKYVANAVMLGDQRKFCIMLVVPNFDQLERWAKRKQPRLRRPRALIRLPAGPGQDGARGGQACSTGLAKYETPKKVLLLEHDFSIETGRPDADAQGAAPGRGEEVPAADRRHRTPTGRRRRWTSSSRVASALPRRPDEHAGAARQLGDPRGAGVLVLDHESQAGEQHARPLGEPRLARGSAPRTTARIDDLNGRPRGDSSTERASRRRRTVPAGAIDATTWTSGRAGEVRRQPAAASEAQEAAGPQPSAA